LTLKSFHNSDRLAIAARAQQAR